MKIDRQNILKKIYFTLLSIQGPPGEYDELITKGNMGSRGDSGPNGDPGVPGPTGELCMTSSAVTND